MFKLKSKACALRTIISSTALLLSLSTGAFGISIDVPADSKYWQQVLKQSTPDYVRAPQLLSDLKDYTLKITFQKPEDFWRMLLNEDTWISAGNVLRRKELTQGSGRDSSVGGPQYYRGIPGACSFVVSSRLANLLRNPKSEEAKKTILTSVSVASTLYFQASEQTYTGFGGHDTMLGEPPASTPLRERPAKEYRSFLDYLDPRRLILTTSDGHAAIGCLKNSTESYSLYNLAAIFGAKAKVVLTNAKARQ